ncbi:hypothetical protein D9M69_359740 [compost metagenome]
MTVGVFGQALEQLVALLPALSALCAGVGFVHDDELGAEALKGFAPTFGLDVVQAHHGERVRIEHGGAGWQVTLQPVSGV